MKTPPPSPSTSQIFVFDKKIRKMLYFVKKIRNACRLIRKILMSVLNKPNASEKTQVPIFETTYSPIVLQFQNSIKNRLFKSL